MTKRLICIAEDRASEEDALRLLVSSLQSFSDPDTGIRLFTPSASDAFTEWASAFPAVRVERNHFFPGGGWNIKPAALLSLLNEGADQVMWIDSDIIVTRLLTKLWERATENGFIVAEEPWMAQKIRGDSRARAWGRAVGRELKSTLNSGILVAGQKHKPLLEAWRKAMAEPDYVEAQAKPFNDRPIHMRSDQDVLTVVLCSEDQAGVPIDILRSGPDIIQYVTPASYSLGARLSHMGAGQEPYFVHSMRRKPWRQAHGGTAESGFVDDVICETSPYNVAAKQVATGLDADMPWLNRSTWLGRVFNLFAGIHPALAGAPLSLADSIARTAVTLIRPIR